MNGDGDLGCHIATTPHNIVIDSVDECRLSRGPPAGTPTRHGLSSRVASIGLSDGFSRSSRKQWLESGLRSYSS